MYILLHRKVHVLLQDLPVVNSFVGSPEELTEANFTKVVVSREPHQASSHCQVCTSMSAGQNYLAKQLDLCDHGHTRIHLASFQVVRLWLNTSGC